MVQVEKLKSSDLRASRGTLNVSEWMPRSVANYQATITEQEEATIDSWVNKNYAMYSDAYRNSVKQDALAAVQKKKSELERQQLNRKRKRELYEQAYYDWKNLEDNQKKLLAKAQLAYSNAAEMIRAGQEMNWIRPDKWLSDKETVAYFIQANQETPFGEYVNRYMDSQVSDWYYDNEWLAIKLWLKEWTTSDKFQAGVKWYAQWISDFAQNTMWRTAEYLWSNIAAGIWEWLYWIADFFWADTSEWSVWDRMKKAEWYTWEEAGKQASSEDMWKQWLLTEEQQAFDTGRWLWQLTTEIALTAPIEAGLWWAISATSLPKKVKWFLQAANLAAGWAAFQWIDDLTTNEKSSWAQYLKSALLNAWTGWLFNMIWKVFKLWKSAWYKLYWPKWQDETALFTQTPEKWAEKTKVNKEFAKDVNAAKTPYTEIADDLEKTAETTYWTRVAKWQELEAVEKSLTYWEKPYTAKEVIDDLEVEFWKLWWWPNAKLPKFTIEWKTLKIDKDWLETLNAITKTDGSNIKLWDEILQAWNNRFSRLDKPLDAYNTKLFIDDLKRILKDEWYNKTWWETIRAMKNALNWVKEWEWIVNKFNNSLSKESLDALSKAKPAAKEAITTDENLNKVLWVLRNTDMVWRVWAAEKALWWKAQMQQLFSEINEKYWIDMNNEILAWAYNMSLYDKWKAKALIETFYPSVPWMYEAVLRVFSKSQRIKQAEKAVKQWKDKIEKLKKSPSWPWLVWWNAWRIISTQTNILWENPRADK